MDRYYNSFALVEQRLYKQLVVNRVRGSRGSLLNKISDIWWKGPLWIAVNKKWPDQPSLSESKESEKEAELI